MTSQTTTANPEKEYFDAFDEAKKRGCSPSQIVLEKRIDAESTTLQPDAKEKADALREKAEQLSAQAEAVDAERRSIAAAWNRAMASWKEAGTRLESAQAILTFAEDSLAKIADVFLQDACQPGGPDAISLAETIVGRETALPKLRELVKHCQRTHHQAFEALRKLTEQHAIPRECWPPALRA